MFINYLLTNPIRYFQIVAILIVSICLHELGHGMAAIYQGDNTPIQRGHMTLNPVVHMGQQSLMFLFLVGMAWGAMPVNPYRFKDGKWGNMLVSAAGPLTNFALGILAVCFIRLANLTFLGNFLSTEFLFLAALYNFALGMFNLVPIPPLDGFSIASELFPEIKVLESSEIRLVLFIVLFMTAGRILFPLAQSLTIFLIGL